MHICVVASQITALCEVLVTDVALIWSLVSVFAEVVAKVAALAEYCHAAGVLAAEVLL